MEEALQFSTRCDCVADGSSARPGTDGAPRGHPTPQALHRQESKDVPQSGHAWTWGQLPPGAQPAAEGRDRLERTGPHPWTFCKGGGGRVCWVALEGVPHTSWGLARVCLGVGEACPLLGGLQVPPGKGTPTPTAAGQPHTCYHRASPQTGAQREPTAPPAAWPKVTETTHESQKFVQMHPPPSLGGQEGPRPGRRVRRAVRADAAAGSARRREAGRGPGAACAAPNSSGRPTCATAGPPGCARSSRPRRTRLRAAG